METEEYTTMKSNASEQKRTGLQQQADQAKDAVKQSVAETTHHVKEQARQVAHEARQAVGEIAADTTQTVKQTTQEALGEARSRAESVVDERKTQAADRLQGIAGALRETSNTLHGQEEDAFANYAAAAADQVEKFSGYPRNQNLNNVLQDVEQFARRQPEIFLAGTLAAGFLLGRFFKSSSASQFTGYQGQGAQRYGASPNPYGAPTGGYRGYDPSSYRTSNAAYPGQSYQDQRQYSSGQAAYQSQATSAEQSYIDQGQTTATGQSRASQQRPWQDQSEKSTAASTKEA